jgi:hypothetical protein
VCFPGDQAAAQAPEHVRHGEQEHHGRAVQAEQLVVEVGVDEAVLGPGELNPHQQRKRSGEQEEHEGRENEAAADRLVIGGAEPADDAAGDGPASLEPLPLCSRILDR